MYHQPTELFINAFFTYNGTQCFTGLIVDNLLNFSDKLLRFKRVRSLIMCFSICHCLLIKSIIHIFHYTFVEEVWNFFVSLSGADSQENFVSLPHIRGLQIIHSRWFCKKKKYEVIVFVLEQRKTNNKR